RPHVLASLYGLTHRAAARARQRLLLVAAATTQGVGAPAAALVLQAAVLNRAGMSLADPIAIDALSQQALILHSLGRDSAAYEEIERARRGLARTPDDSLQRRLTQRVSIVEAEIGLRRDPEEALALLETINLAGTGLDQLMGAQLGLLKADANLALGRLAAAEDALMAGIASFEAQRSSLSDEGRLSYTERSWGLFERAIQLELRRGHLDAAFDMSERARAKTLLEARQWGSTKRLTLDELRARLDDSTGVLVLNQFEDHLVTWLVTRSGTESRTVDITRDRARALVASQHGELVSAAATPRASAELFDAVVRPFGTDASGLASLVVIPDTPYESVSFAALFDRSRQRFLIQDASVAVAPSATVYERAVARSRTEGAHALSALVLGAPATTPGSGASTLPSSFDEAAAVAALYPSAELRSGVMATPARLMAEGPRRDVIHIAAHAQPNQQYPLLSRLLLADEPGQPHSGAVLASRLADHDFSHTRVVVLAACDGAGGASVRGEGALSLARAFLAAGTPAVVSALGPLDDAKAQPLFVEFHRRYATGTPVGEALRQVQLQAIARAPGHLGAWAGLAVFGASN
ncbi:MAG: CHAT domain-containing protein, partial [Vicinamibacterales bacterium]